MCLYGAVDRHVWNVDFQSEISLYDMRVLSRI